MQFLGVDAVQLDWNDTSDSELGFIVEQSKDGAPFEVVAELASGSASAAVPVDPAVEDILLRLSSYNAAGDSAAATEIDLLAPENWRHRQFAALDPELDDPVSQWTTDADGDGEATIWEYAAATDPRMAASVLRRVARVGTEGADSFLELWVPRDARRSVEIVGSVSPDLINWSSGPPHCEVAADEPDHLLLRSTTPVGSIPRQFLRAEISVP